MGIGSIVKGAAKYFAKNAPYFLTSAGVVGAGATVIIGAKKIPEAKIEIENLKASNPEATIKDLAKVAYKPLVPVIFMGGASVACIVGANCVQAKRLTAVSAAYKMTRKSLDNLNETLDKIPGKPKEKVKDFLAEKMVKDNPPKDSEVIQVSDIPEADKTLCLDAITGRYFESSAERIRQRWNELMSELMDCNDISYNDYCWAQEIAPVEIGGELIWSLDTTGVPELSFSSALTDDDKPVLVIHTTLPVSRRVYCK